MRFWPLRTEQSIGPNTRDLHFNTKPPSRLTASEIWSSISLCLNMGNTFLAELCLPGHLKATLLEKES